MRRLRRLLRSLLRSLLKSLRNLSSPVRILSTSLLILLRSLKRKPNLRR